VRVRAFDADWLQDDDLGSAVTDGAGHFRIDYSRADFEKTIFSPLTPTQIGRTEIGKLQTYAPAFPGDPNPVKTKRYTVNGTAGPNEIVADFTADGFIKVPQQSNVFGPEGYFNPNGNMINLISTAIAAWGNVNQTGVTAGHSSTSGGAALAQDRHFAIRMKVREAGDVGLGTDAGICQHFAIDNTGYDNVVHHPSWAGYTDAPGAIGVNILDILQLQMNGCSQITNALDVLLTAAHPNLGAVALSMIGPGGPYSFSLPPAVPGERFGSTNSFFVASDPMHTPVNVGDLQNCAYLLTLSAQLLLTTGDGVPGNLTDQIAFCKH
jgi:hypothetical protein